jgi:hypothetical protein
MLQSVLFQRAFPLALSFLLLLAAALSLDYILHIAGLAWIGRYLGAAGTLFLLLSFTYSARKRRPGARGPLKLFLRLHCNAGWAGTLMIMVHSGVHFNAVLPWAATLLMLVVTASGHVGQYLLRNFREEVRMKKKQLGIGDAKDEADDSADQRYFWDMVTVRALEQWRHIHMPLVSFLLVLTMMHILTIAFFINWR